MQPPLLCAERGRFAQSNAGGSCSEHGVGLVSSPATGGSALNGADGYDFVVVGAGAAGCVMASRLAQSSSGSVVLVEAGPDLRGETPAPLRDGWRIEREPDWGFVSEPNPYGNVQKVWRNKLVGGT